MTTRTGLISDSHDPRYLAVLGGACVANLATVLGLIGLLTLDGYLAQARGILPYTVITYAGARYIAFPVQPTPGSCGRQAGQRS
jgi:hypothetical protein